MKRVIYIGGPTGVGKSEVGIKLAKKINGEILSCDAFQIYKFMDIGTNKIKKEEMEGVPHHMIDIINPNEEFSSALYKEIGLKKIDEIINRKKLPIIVGGTGLYLRTLLYFEPPEKNESIRNFLLERVEKEGLQSLYDELQIVDPDYANKISKNDKKRIVRALEVYYIYKKPFSSFQNKIERFESLKFALIMDRKLLYERIERRVEKMFKSGLIDEVKYIEENFGFSKTSIKAIGYQEILKYLKGEITLDNCKKEIIKKTKEYARKQIIWLKKEKDIIFINIQDKDIERVVKDILEIVRNKWMN
ncbi:MAG: tRNA (adenosine(37)-N6)-dimethylallyltransferase MiaA [Caldisericia bacterium]|nr:tRNA (adenosine(37)-N6)-dimethylallyltransferase MiaA [Caldisericia bacterium]